MSTAPASITYSLEPAEFYIYWDGRGEHQFLFTRREYDLDPKESVRIGRRQMQARLDHDPKASPLWSYPPILRAVDVPMTADHVPARTGYRTRKPKVVNHTDLVGDYCGGDHGSIEVVSPAWKAAIESVEPGVHQFFPYDLVFQDGTVSHFLFRQRGIVKVGHHTVSIEAVWNAQEECIGYVFNDSKGKVPRLTISRAKLEGHHWAREDQGFVTYVSRALAEKLHPLLPADVHLVPIDLDPPAPSPAGMAAGGASVASLPSQRAAKRVGAIDAALIRRLARSRGPQKAWRRARIFFLVRVRVASTRKLFDLMDEALDHDVPLNDNFGLTFAYLACHNRSEREVAGLAKHWLVHADPLHRIAAVRALSRPIEAREQPDPETKALLLAALEERDPFALAEIIGIIAWIGHPDYHHALRARKAAFSKHPDERVRTIYNCLVLTDAEVSEISAATDGEDFAYEIAQETKVLLKRLKRASDAQVLDVIYSAIRRGLDDAEESGFEALQNRPEERVCKAAEPWSRDTDPEKRIIAARVLGRFGYAPATARPATRAVIMGLLRDEDEDVVKAALAAYGHTHAKPFSAVDMLALMRCEQHPDPLVRRGYLELFAAIEDSTDIEVLLRLLRDAAPDVREKANRSLLGLGSSDTPEVREALAARLHDDDLEARAYMIYGLARLKDHRVVEPLLALLQLPREQFVPVSERTMAAVLAMPDKRYLPALNRWNDQLPSDEVKAALGACS